MRSKEKRRVKSEERQHRPVPNDIYLQIKSELFPFHFHWNILEINMLISRPIAAIRRTKMSSHSDDAENDVKFLRIILLSESECISIFLFPSLLRSLALGINYLHFLIDSLNSLSDIHRQTILLNVEITQWQSKQAHVFLFVASSNQQRINGS